RKSRKVVAAPMTTLSAFTSTERRSGMPHKLTSFGALSRPAAKATISSVPPAIGVHAPGSAASRLSTASSLPGAMRLCIAALPRIANLFGCRFSRFDAGCLNHGLEDANKASAAAKIPRESFANFGHAGMRVFRKKLRGSHQHARGANAALGAALLQKRF